jgi:hypothetical protein
MKCFVIMPYGNREKDPLRKQGLDGLYEHFIRPAVEAVVLPNDPTKHVICHRGDKEPRPGEIIAHIIENLVLSELAIADLTGRNSNVFYELGVRHAVNDNTILISESEEDVPFDLRGQRLILYKRDFEGGGRLRSEITRAVHDIVCSPGKIDNPVRRFLFDRERDKMLQQIQTQGRPPGYDFVNELLQEMSNLRKDFSVQINEMRQVMKAVTEKSPISVTGKQEADDLRFVEGAWYAKHSGSHLYARIIKGRLVMPYCYAGDDSLIARFYNFRRIEETIFARFQWFNSSTTRGYSKVTIQSQDHLVGGWWYAPEILEELGVEMTPGVTPPSPQMHPWDLTRLRKKSIPKWAEDYFKRCEAGDEPLD